MQNINRYSHGENQPIHLSDEQKQNLYAVLEDFFSCFHLQDARRFLWDWLVAALASETCTYNTGYARSNLVFVYEKMQLLIEAAHEINKRRKHKQKWKNRNWKARA